MVTGQDKHGHWQPDELQAFDINNCTYTVTTDNPTCKAGYIRDPMLTIDDKYDYDEANAVDFCLPMQASCLVKEGDTEIGTGVKVWNYTTKRLSETCYMTNCTKEGYHTEFDYTLTKNQSNNYRDVDVYKCYINETSCTAYLTDIIKNSEQTFCPNNGTIEGNVKWENDAWNTNSCTCTYDARDLSITWEKTSQAKVRFKWNNDDARWFNPTDTSDCDDTSICEILETYACTISYCIPEGETFCDLAPNGYYHDKDTDTKCLSCPVGSTTEDYEKSSINECRFIGGITSFCEEQKCFTLPDDIDPIFY